MFDNIIRDNLTYDDQEGKKAKHTPQVVLRCMSCGAPIRIGQKYHCLHVKGQPWAFCKLCIGLSEYTAQKEAKK